jgi:hypothetical protein
MQFRTPDHWCKEDSPTPEGALVENDGFVSVEQDAVFDVPADGSREHYLFEVAAFFHQVLDRVTVRYALDALLDDGPVIQHFRDVVRRSADDFHATVKGLLVWLRSDKRGQERMMNIDDLLRKLLDKLR